MATAEQQDCPRKIEGPFRINEFKYLNRPDDGTCDYCGSLLGDEFMRRLEAGDIELGPTDKSYKVYVRNKGGALFKQSSRTDPGGTMDQTKWVWQTREMEQCKFYFQHLTEQQQIRFVELLNEKKIKFGEPGRFYVTPFFIRIGPK